MGVDGFHSCRRVLYASLLFTSYMEILIQSHLKIYHLLKSFENKSQLKLIFPVWFPQIGNALVCLAVYTNQSMRTVTNIFIVNLAIADFFVILFCLPPTVIWDVTETWFLGNTMCKVVIYFQTVSVTVSILTLTFISIDRWYAICFPLRYKPQPERALLSIGIIWLIGILFDLPEFDALKTEKKDLRFDVDLFTQCTTDWSTRAEKIFYIIKLIFLYT